MNTGTCPSSACFRVENRRRLEPQTIFFLASDLSACGSARQLARLALGLSRDRYRVEVAVLGSAATPLAQALASSGIPVHSVPIRNAIDFSAMRRLRRIVAAANPRIIHAWGPAAVRATRLVATPRTDGGNQPRVIASAASFLPQGIAGWLAARRLRRCDRVVPSTWAEAERYRRLGVLGERLTRIAPGIAPPGAPPNRETLAKELGLPEVARFIAVAGRLEGASDFKSAIWAFDLVRYEYPELHLVIFGEGPERQALEEFARALMFDDLRVRFAGSRADLPEALAHAEFVWITHERGGVALALEAMAAGKPVLGWSTPELAEVVEDEQAEHLVAPADRAQLAVKTYPLLRDPTLATRFARAGVRHVGEHYSERRMIEQFERLYDELVR